MVQLQRVLGLMAIGIGLSSVSTGCAQTVEPKAVQPPAADASSNAIAASPGAIAQSPSPAVSDKEPDVVYVPTPEIVVRTMLDLAKVSKTDVLYDLGSGDGRIVVTAAQKYGARGTGIELRPELIQEAQENAKKAGVASRAKFIQADLFTTDFKDATVVTLYLLPDLNVKLRPRLLKELKPGTRIVSHDFDMGEWKPEQVVKVKGPQREHTIYFWRVPENPPKNLL
ncbi:class I SAM-dependent methyltransferase [Leptolyngbya sp. FACHB-36]|uniref:class I SAM-dependent methyltransferase n=1 Tax=Leptolyngbya sp. FACHB-36 TaxID=2692808 RepID=UPI0016810857|nr:class I SAM-dependent methyltransferase [Leptolyngbya sp. FACHB-36]MBD2020851.1 class I SAM-dependent methyltransferase [Leptolyngbya sp. FACHB-36]